jgi:hypothetical protein
MIIGQSLLLGNIQKQLAKLGSFSLRGAVACQQC